MGHFVKDLLHGNLFDRCAHMMGKVRVGSYKENVGTSQFFSFNNLPLFPDKVTINAVRTWIFIPKRMEVNVVYKMRK